MPKFGKDQSGNPRGRPTNEARNKSLEELLVEATAHLELRNSKGQRISPQEARMRALFQGLFNGDPLAARQILRLGRQFFPKSRPHFEMPAPGLFVEIELTQAIVDELHAEGYFPGGTPNILEEIDEQTLTEAVKARRRDRVPD